MFIFDIVVWYYHIFCPSRFGFTHEYFTNYFFFLCFLRKKDPYTWWKKINMEMMPLSQKFLPRFAAIGDYTIMVRKNLPVKRVKS